MGIILAPIIK